MSTALRAFAPSPALTVLVLLLVALFVRLGVWQWQKGAAAEAEWRRFARGADAVLELGSRSAGEVPLYQRVRVSGALDGAHQFLLDNRSHGGLPGYEVLTPLARAGAPVLLIDRGWVPFTGRRAQLPDVTLRIEGPVTLTGRFARLPSAGLDRGRAPPGARAPWPRLTSFPRSGELAAALGAPVAEHVLWLDAGSPFGYVCDWQPPGMAPLRHTAYAIQWWSFAALALILSGLASLRRGRGGGG